MTHSPPFLQDDFTGAAHGHAYNPEVIARQVAARRAEIAHDLGLGDGAAHAGIIDNGTGVQRRNAELERQSREKDNREKIDRILLLQINERLAEIDSRLGELYEEQARLEQEISEHETAIAILDAAIDGLENCEPPALNEDGTLQNGRLEDELSAYERRTGQKIDRHDPEALHDALKAQRAHREAELAKAHEAHGHNKGEIGDLRKERGKLEAERSHLAKKYDAEVDEMSAKAQNELKNGGIQMSMDISGSIGVINEKLKIEPELDLDLEDIGAEYGSFAEEIDPLPATKEPDTALENTITNTGPAMGGPAPS